MQTGLTGAGSARKVRTKIKDTQDRQEHLGVLAQSRSRLQSFTALHMGQFKCSVTSNYELTDMGLLQEV